MNVDDLISELEDICGDLQDSSKVTKKPTTTASSSSTTNSYQSSNTYSGQNQKNINSNYNNTYTSSNKFGDDDDDNDYFKPISNPTKPSYTIQNKQYEETVITKKSSNNQNSGVGGIDDLLDILQSEDYNIQQTKSNYNQQNNYSQPISSNDQPKQKQKQTTCLNPYLCNGDSEYTNDEYNMKKRVCNALRCTLCNILITKLVNYKWACDVDLLFFRNNFSRKEKLLTKAISDNNYSAYSCQCRGTSVNKLQTLSDCNMKEWRCIGHFD